MMGQDGVDWVLPFSRVCGLLFLKFKKWDLVLRSRPATRRHVVLGGVSILGCGGVTRTRLSFSPGVGYFVNRGKRKGAGILSTICFLSFYGDSAGSISSVGVQRRRRFFVLRKRCRRRSKSLRRICYKLGHGRGGHFGQGGGRCGHLSRRVNLVPLILMSPTSTRLVLKKDRRHHEFVSVIVIRCSRSCLRTLMHCGGTLLRHGILLGRRRRPSTRLVDL